MGLVGVSVKMKRVFARHDGGFQRFIIPHRHDMLVATPNFFRGRIAKLPCPPITIIGHDDMRIRAQHRQEERRNSRHARGVDDRVFSAFQIRQCDRSTDQTEGIAVTPVFFAVQMRRRRPSCLEKFD